MTSKKSIDGLSPRRLKSASSSVNADGFTPVTKPRKTSKSSRIRSSALSPANLITPEDFIPPRKTTKGTRSKTLRTPQLSTPTYPTPPLKSSKISASTPEDSDFETIDDVNEEFLEPLKTFAFDEETGELMSTKDYTEEDEKSPKAGKSKKAKKTKKKWSKKRKFWTLFGLILLALIVAVAVWFILWGNDLLKKLAGGGGNILDLFSENYQPLEEDQNGRTNILAFGTSGFDMSGTEFGGGIHDGAQLTDSIMIVSFDQNTGVADLISLPRDLKFDGGCNYTGKINEIYDCNDPDGTDEAAGAKALTDAIEEILGIDLQYYAHVNWGSLESVVNAIGGITVTLDEPVHDYDYTGADYEANTPYHLDGGQAIGLARARHGTESGDFSRGAFQQKILLGIKDKVLQEGLSVPDLINLANTLGDNLRTDFTVSELKSLAHIATTIDWNSITEVSFLEPEPLLTDGMIDGISYVFPTAGVTNFSEIQSYIKELLTPPKTESEEDSTAKKAQTVAEENASILVLNSTGITGLASAEQAALEAAGFSNITIDNFITVSNTPYTIYSFTTTKPTTSTALADRYSVTPLNGTNTNGLPQGYDFILILGNQ